MLVSDLQRLGMKLGHCGWITGPGGCSVIILRISNWMGWMNLDFSSKNRTVLRDFSGVLRCLLLERKSKGLEHFTIVGGWLVPQPIWKICDARQIGANETPKFGMEINKYLKPPSSASLKKKHLLEFVKDRQTKTSFAQVTDIYCPPQN